jgi:hypothetical protein
MPDFTNAPAIQRHRSVRFSEVCHELSAVTAILCAVVCFMTSPVRADEALLSIGNYLITKSAVTKAEAIGIANQFVQAANQGDAETCGRIFDVSAMIARQNTDLDVPVDFRDAFVAGVKASWTEFPNFAKSGGDYAVLRVVDRVDGPHVIVRMMQQQYSINYHELIFSRDERGMARISDVYVMTMGETMGAIFRRLLLAGYADEHSPSMSKVFSSQAQAIEIGRLLKSIPSLVETDPKLALKEIAKLPTALRNEKGMLMLRLNAASSIDETEYNTAYQAFAKAFPEDSSLDLHSISYHFNRGEFLASRAAVERLNIAVGGDTKLDEVIAMINAAMMKAALSID